MERLNLVIELKSTIFAGNLFQASVVTGMNLSQGPETTDYPQILLTALKCQFKTCIATNLCKKKLNM